MIACTYCELPLVCEGCQTPYIPPDPAHYQALSQEEVAVTCLSCGEVLVCKWCQTRYDGLPSGDDSPARG